MNEQTTALAVRPLTPDVWQMIEAVAPAMHLSRFYGVTSKEAAAAIMLKGYELGLGLAAAFEFVQIVMGKPTLIPRGALALIHQSKELAGMKITEAPNSCTVWMKRRNGFEYTLTFTMQDAQRAGVVKPGSAWESYPANMLRWRTIGFVADVVFPDLLGGLKRADELGADLDSAGNVVEGEWKTVEPTTVQATVEPTTTDVPFTLDGLVTVYGAEAVMVAAGGRIPASVEEVAAVAATLANG